MTRPLIVACAAALVVITSAATQHTLGQNNYRTGPGWCEASTETARQGLRAALVTTRRISTPRASQEIQGGVSLPLQWGGRGGPWARFASKSRIRCETVARTQLRCSSMCQKTVWLDGHGRQVLDALLRPAPRPTLARSCEPGSPAERTARRLMGSSNGKSYPQLRRTRAQMSIVVRGALVVAPGATAFGQAERSNLSSIASGMNRVRDAYM